MTLIVEMPEGRSIERDHILDVVLGDFLGIEWVRRTSQKCEVRICVSGDPDGAVILPDAFFAQERWLSASSLPKQPLVRWDCTELGFVICSTSPVVPIIYGEGKSAVVGRTVRLPLDVFGSAFFMLFRYEEIVRGRRDEYDRFPSDESLARQEGFLDRPIVDEYVEILWGALKFVWPQLLRKVRKGRTVVSCDVDNPYAAYTQSWSRTLRKSVGDIVKRLDAGEAIRTIGNTVFTRRGDYRHDPYDTFDWIMDVNERAGNRVIFYFLCRRSAADFDAHYSIGEARIRKLMQRMHARGHELGVHGSFVTYDNQNQMVAEVRALRRVMEEEGIEQESVGNRQHYLRWDAAVTPNVLELAGVQHDSSLGFADRAGFRCGTCHSFRAFDVASGMALSFRERPLIAMECSVLDAPYMALGYSEEALGVFDGLKERCLKFGGEFVLLWHNSHFRQRRDAEFYRSLVQ